MSGAVAVRTGDSAEGAAGGIDLGVGASASGDGGDVNVDALKIRWYPAIYAPFLGSLVQEGDITQLVPKGERDVAILEEPEHLNW